MTAIGPLWRLQALQPVEGVLYRDELGFVLQIERGAEREVFWHERAASVSAALEVSATVRDRLVNGGWALEWEAPVEAA